MKTNAGILLAWFATAGLLFQSLPGGYAQVPTASAQRKQTERNGVLQQTDTRAKTVKEVKQDGSLHRITGRARVIDAHTIAFEDGTEVDLNGVIDAPELEQKALIEDSLYPCGKEAAEFLKKLIGDQPVTFLSFGGKERRPRGNCYDGEIFLQEAMVRNGWAVSDHSATELAQLIAQEKKRGLWRGRFIPQKRWRKGERLPGE
jgi:endonuclease YncB( thermonuclease family)